MLNKQTRYLWLGVILIVSLSGCGSNKPANWQIQVSQANQQEAIAWQSCQNATDTYTCESFIKSYPNSTFIAGARQKLQQLRNYAKQMQAAEEQKKQDAKFERDKQLPIEVRRDKYMIALTSHLKNEKYQESLQYFEWLERLDTELAPSFNYFYGEAFLKLNKPQSAIKKLYAYLEEVGAKGKYYTKALELVNEAESMDIVEAPSASSQDYSNTSNSLCPGGPAQLLSSMPNTVPLQVPGSVIQTLICRYGDKGEYLLEAAHSSGNPRVACRDPQQNPKLSPNYNPAPLVIFPPQAVPMFGFSFQDIAGSPGVAVDRLMLGMAAEKAGLQIGDQIIAINGDKNAVSGQKMAAEAFAKLQKANLTVRRYGNTMLFHLDRAKSVSPKVAVLHNTDILALVKVNVPSHISDEEMNKWVESGRSLLNSISGSAVSCR